MSAWLYWIGITMSVLCVALTCARNTKALVRFEHTGFPWSWAAGLIAILAFVIWEYCSPAPLVRRRSARSVATEVPESLRWENEFAD